MDRFPMNNANAAAAVEDPPTVPTTAPERPERDDRMPSGIPYIISNEFAERFCFYGINSILAIYLTQHMHFTDSKAASWSSMFKSGAYFFPMIGAVISDVFWGKFRTIFVFSLLYAAGCVALALVGNTPMALAASLFFVALGTGGIKPCVSTNVGDQFTSKNQHLIERAFSWFYLAINAGSSISIFMCPVLLNKEGYGPRWAFGMPAAMMMLATIAFIAGRHRYAHVPPAGKAWLEEIASKDGVKLVVSLLGIYFFVAMFWMLWDQSNGNTWTLQAASSLMDKNLGFGITVLPAQLQVVNGLFILALVPIFTYGVYPLWGKFFKVTPLRKIGIGLFTIAASFVIVGWIEKRIQDGHTVSAWWQIIAYVVLTASEILVSITALEFSYKQAPLRLKSFIMALFLLSTSLGNLGVAAVNKAMVKPLHATAVDTGAETWIKLDEAAQIENGQKIDLTGDKSGTGLTLATADGKPALDKEGKPQTLEGTYLAAEVDAAGSRVRLMDAVDRASVHSLGTLSAKAEVSTYYLVGPMYFYFFVGVMCVMGVLFIFFAMAYKERTFVRE
jgi:POT family proton-dependent oligopeptide transporter